MQNDNQNPLLYDIDKRLAVLETQHREHSKRIEMQLTKIEKQLDSLRIKVYGSAATIVMVMELAFRYMKL